MARPTLCRKELFPSTMGVHPGAAPGGPPRIVEDPVAFARSSGWGRADPTEVRQVADGTHKDLYVDSTVGPLAHAACPLFVDSDQDLEALTERFDDLLMDGEDITSFMCSDRLGLCPSVRDEL
eukprot:TRINITY_DN25142_c0_g1_i2.p3 TRINITY_DN25142_c0_g1~~TRINITY_DN25142_c0_g1_i2.p3  ORF type:complete len:123 (-),score=18.25 TRINITY_DN25142_c0_g1_i2:42-410(-)